MNIIISLAHILLGLYILYGIYEKPSLRPGTNFSGVIGGVGLVFLGFFSLIGKIELIKIYKDIF